MAEAAVVSSNSTAKPALAPTRHDGGLRPVVGVHEYAVMRPTKNTGAGALSGHAVHPSTFNHHPFLTYWKNKFWNAYIAYDVKDSSKRLRLQWSNDGRSWHNGDAADIFPKPMGTHQRTAFYIANNGRLLVTTWYSEKGEHGRGEKGTRFCTRN